MNLLQVYCNFFQKPNVGRFLNKIPAGGTRFAPAFLAGARAQTKPPSGLFFKLLGFL